MTSVSEFWSMRCPKCGRDDGLDICADVWVRLTPDGTDMGQSACGDHHWNEHHGCTCTHCGHEGVVSDFDISRQPKKGSEE